MPESDKITLAEARKQGKVDQFVSEHRGQPPSDKAAFQATLNSMSGKSKSGPGTSTPGCSDD